MTRVEAAPMPCMKRRIVSRMPTPNADVFITGNERYEKCGTPHQQQRRDQGRLSPQAVPVMAEDGCADGPREKTHGVHTESF